VLDDYARARAKPNWTWIKEVDLLRQFSGFSADREWSSKNPAKKLKLPPVARSE
jgi:hypothetical protein